MIEPDLKQQLDNLNKSLSEINRKTGISPWRAFMNGTLSGLGSVIGVALAIAVIGWILNIVGIIPAFKDKVNSWQGTIESLQRK